MIIYGIYSNIQNKYIYIGQTNSFSRRKDEHYFTGHLDIDKLGHQVLLYPEVIAN